VKVLLVTMYFPPAGGGGVQRSLKLAQYLPALGIETHVLAPDDPKWVHRDPELRVPTARGTSARARGSRRKSFALRTASSACSSRRKSQPVVSSCPTRA
jgi:hypothetical protein